VFPHGIEGRSHSERERIGVQSNAIGGKVRGKPLERVRGCGVPANRVADLRQGGPPAEPVGDVGGVVQAMNCEEPPERLWMPICTTRPTDRD
jgi:hypothetical protein